jgi:tetratricopeptide (TPR) repeat protein
VEVSRRLLQLRWRAGQEAAAAELALETAQAGHGGPPDDLWLRAGFALGALGRHEEAAGAFAKVSRREWEDPAAALRALALHRAGQPQQALAAALAALDLLRAPGKTAPGGGPPIERWGEAHDAVRRVAVDALDLLGVAPDGLPGGSAENQALVLGVAARRALFRGQAALARARAEQALRLAPRSREAAAPLEVLWRLAERAGDAPGAERYQAQLGALRDEGTTIRLTPPGVEEEEAQQMGEAPTAERLVEALVRLCAEPLAWKAAGGLGKLTIEARVYDDGKVEPRVLASGNEATQAIGACVRQQAPSALEAAPSLRVTVELARLGGPGRPR